MPSVKKDSEQKQEHIHSHNRNTLWTYRRKKPRAITIGGEVMKKFGYEKDISLLKEMLELNIDESSFADLIVERNVLWGLMARIMEKLGQHGIRDKMFHHHNLLPLPNSVPLELTLGNEEIREMAHSVLNGSFKENDLFNKISKHNNMEIPDKNQEQQQIAWGEQENRIYPCCKSMPIGFVTIACLYTCARLDTYGCKNEFGRQFRHEATLEPIVKRFLSEKFSTSTSTTVASLKM
jgi:hypothetical protein